MGTCLTFIFRGGLPVAVPTTYATDPTHVSLVERLNRTTLYLHAIVILESHTTDGYLAVDVLNGAPWAKRYLNSTAQLWAGSRQNRMLASRGWRALMHLLNGTKPRTGRRRESLSPAAMAKAGVAISRWRGVVDSAWGQDRPTMAAALLKEAETRFRVSRAHGHALRTLLRRKGLRKHLVVLTLASWETGLALRRLRGASSVADLVYA